VFQTDINVDYNTFRLLYFHTISNDKSNPEIYDDDNDLNISEVHKTKQSLALSHIMPFAKSCLHFAEFAKAT